MVKPTEKTCSDCKEIKDLDEFSKKKRGLYGHDSICKRCYSERVMNHYYELKKRKTIIYPTEKHCPCCDTMKPLIEWTKNKGSKDGLQSYCKKCLKQLKLKYRSKKENRENEKRQRQKYWNKPENRERENKRRRVATKTNPNFKISKLERSRVYHALKSQNASTNYKQDERLGCSIAEFRVWLESQFRDGMTWENHGTLWHIDHIKPLSWFDLTDEEQQKEAFHHTNQQPLLAEENWNKSDKYIG